jgi:hypothetical protein
MNELLKLCIFCTIPVGHPPLPDMAREVGDIWYRHEVLYGDHLLRLSTTDLIIDTDALREQRLFAFASNFADQTCNGRFRITKVVRETTSAGRFWFKCTVAK